MRTRVILAAIVLVAIAVRFGHLAAIQNDVLFDHPVADEQRYVTDARALVRGETPEAAAYWQPPGILYALTAVFRIAGPELGWPRIVQALLSAAACLVVFALARRFFDERIALAAAAVAALHGVLVFAAGELLAATWVVFFDLVALVLLARGGWPAALGGGVALGISAVFRPTILVFVPVAAAWVWFRAATRRARALAAAAVVAGALLPVAPVAWRNWNTGGELVLVSTNGGVNFYLGNNARYEETIAIRPGRHWTELVQEPRRAGIIAPGQHSAYFYDKALSWIAGDPLGAAALTARKVYLYLNGGEIPRDTDLRAARESSPVLAALVWPGPLSFPNGLLVPLALVGLVASWQRRRQFWLLHGYLATQLVITVAFFVTSRYRVPAIPVLAILACVGAAALWRERRLAVWAGVLALVVALNLPTRETRFSYDAELDFYRGLAHLRARGDLARAAEAFARAAERDPADPRPSFELGNTYQAMARLPKAIEAWRRAADADPWDSRSRRRAAVALVSMGNLDEAIRELEANVASRQREPAHYAFEHFNLGTLYHDRGDDVRALEHHREAARLDPAYFAEHARNYVDRVGGEGPYWDELRRLLGR